MSIKISPQTTCGELALVCAQYGVTKLKVALRHDGVGPIIRSLSGVGAHAVGGVGEHVYSCALQSDRATTIGTGLTFAEAVDDAFARLWHLIGYQVVQARDPASDPGS